MQLSRRQIIKSSAVAAAAAGIASRPAMAMLGNGPVEVPPVQDPRLKELIERAIDGAMSAGATFADARLTYVGSLTYQGEAAAREEMMAFGVRALVDGFWGFAASPVWDIGEAHRLGRAAYAQAKANSLGEPREISMPPVNDVMSGHWETPVKDDPFEIHYNEISDYMGGLMRFMSRLKFVRRRILSTVFFRTDKVFGSSHGQYLTQRQYTTAAGIMISLEDRDRGKTGMFVIDPITAAGRGFEHLRDQDVREMIRKEHANILEDWKLPVKPVDVGRYNVILDQKAMGSLALQTVGYATEIDRIMGYEANATGTSYIVDPVESVGTLKIGENRVNISSDRSMPGGAATVGWDEEGVAPKDTQLVKDGILSAIQANREGAGWIKEQLDRDRQPFQSTGNSYAFSAIEAPSIHSGNIVVHGVPGGPDSLDDLRTEMADGIEFSGLTIDLDHQQISGYASGKAYEIKAGKRVALITNAGALFRTPELWGGVISMGSDKSALTVGTAQAKGEPQVVSYHSTSAPPAIIKEMNIIDIKRKG